MTCWLPRLRHDGAARVYPWLRAVADGDQAASNFAFSDENNLLADQRAAEDESDGHVLGEAVVT